MDVSTQAYSDLAGQLLAVVVTVVFGGIGYLLAEFWFGPIGRYLGLRRQVASDLVYYANALTTHAQTSAERLSANRRLAADLQAASFELPRWYRKRLARRGQDPARAASELLGLSNTQVLDEAHGRIAEMQALLGLGYIVVSEPESKRLRGK